MDGAYDLFALDLAAGNRVTPITQTPGFAEFRADLSPDGRWLALQSDESGTAEIYVQPFPGPGRRWQLSTGGGFFPVWSRDGSEIFFRDGQGRLSHVAVTAGADFDAGVPEALFPLADRDRQLGAQVRRHARRPALPGAGPHLRGGQADQRDRRLGRHLPH